MVGHGDFRTHLSWSPSLSNTSAWTSASSRKKKQTMLLADRVGRGGVGLWTETRFLHGLPSPDGQRFWVISLGVSLHKLAR